MAFAKVCPDVIVNVQNRYAEPHRAYHTWAHIETLHQQFVTLDWANRQAVEIALYFHDAIYAPLAPDNEAASAELMIETLRDRVEAPTLRWAEAIVLATARHAVPDAAKADLAADIRQFLDIDLSILGAAPDAFDAYDAQIRTEFAAVPDDVFYPRRRQVMAGFLERPRLYLTDAYHASHDAPARANLARLVDRLSGA